MMKRTIIISALILLSSHLVAQVELGGTTDYTEVEEDGTILFHEAATVWDDFVVPMSLAKTGTNAPVWTTFMGDLHAFLFDDAGANSEDEVEFVIQMPHKWDGSTIYPHIHWSPETAGGGSVVWALEYTWVNYSSGTHLAFPATETLYATSEELTGNALRHLITGFDGGITPIEDLQDKISSILILRLYRNSSNSSDTYSDGAFGLSFDIHYRINTVGSREEYVK